MQLGFEISEHVAGRGTDAAGAGEGVQVPWGSWPAIEAVSLHEAVALSGRERDRGVLHPQRACDLALQKFRIAGARAISQCRPKHGEAQIAVKEFRIRDLSDPVPLNEIVEIGGVIAGELLAQVAWGRVIG